MNIKTLAIIMTLSMMLGCAHTVNGLVGGVGGVPAVEFIKHDSQEPKPDKYDGFGYGLMTGCHWFLMGALYFVNPIAGGIYTAGSIAYGAVRLNSVKIK